MLNFSNQLSKEPLVSSRREFQKTTDMSFHAHLAGEINKIGWDRFYEPYVIIGLPLLRYTVGSNPLMRHLVPYS